MNVDPEPEKTQLDDYDLVRMGRDLATLGVGCLPVVLFFAGLNYIFAVWIFRRAPDTGLFRFMASVLWRSLVYILMGAVACAVLGLLVRGLLVLARVTNKRAAESLARLYPKPGLSLVEEVSRQVHRALGFVWMFFGLGGFILLWQRRFSQFWVLFAVMFAATVSTYAYIIFKNRRLGVWVFYKLRRLVIPYLIVTPLACITTVYAGSCLWYLSFRLGFLGDTSAELAIPDPVLRETILSDLISRSSPFRIPITDVVEAILWSSICAVLVVWLFAMAVRRDYWRLVIAAMSFAAPFIKARVAFVDQNFPLWLVPHVPRFTISLLLVIAANLIYSSVQSALGRRIICGGCGSRVSSGMRYCPDCGTYNPRSDQ